MALTDTQVRKAKPAAAQYKIADGGGLYLAVTPQGGKLWRWKYRFEGKEQSMSFGGYPDVSLAQAREARVKTADGHLLSTSAAFSRTRAPIE